MRQSVLAFILMVFLAFPASWAAESDFALPLDGQVRMIMSVSNDVFKSAKVEGSEFNWIAIMNGEGKKFGLQDGVYIFDDPGVFFLYQPIDRCDAVVLAPGGDVVALAVDAPATRQWRFYSFPFMEDMGATVCPSEFPNLTWVQDGGVVYTTLENGDYGRQGVEPLAPRSVAFFDFERKTEQVMLRGTDRYDFFFKSLADRTVSAEKAVAAGAEPVPGLEDMTPVEVSATLPPGDCPELPVNYALAVEARYLGLNSGDEIQVIIEIFPSTIEYSDSNYISLNVMESGHFDAFMSMEVEGRVRVVYDMMQFWDARAGKRIVAPVVRSVEPMPDNDPKG